MAGSFNKLAVQFMLSAAVMAVPFAARAQTVSDPGQTDPQAADQSTRGIEDIVVTAQRRQEASQDVPVAVTAFGTQEIAKANIQTTADLAGRVPSFSVATGSGQRNNETFAIRGQGATLGAGPAVVTYFAEVPLPQSTYAATQGGGAGMFYDLANLQVLRGPQGTLFGRNTTGGAVLFEPRRPEFSFGGYLTAQVGNYSDREVQGALNAVVVPDVLAIRVAGNVISRDGYTHELGSGLDLDDRNRQSVRLGVLFRPGESIENYTLAYWMRVNENGSGNVLGAVNSALFAPGGRLAGLGYTPAQTLAILAAQNARGPRVVGPYNIRPAFYLTTKGITNQFNWDFSDNVRLRWIASYATLFNRAASDSDGSVLPLNGFALPPPGVGETDIDYITNEVQLQGNALDHKIEWIGGVFYDRTRPRGTQVQIGDAAGTVSNSINYERRQSTALFAQASLDFGAFSDGLDGLKLTGGFRYTWDKLHTFSTYAGNNLDVRTEKSAPTYTVSVDYQRRGLLLFAKYSRGYKTGGASVVAVNPQNATFRPEFLNAYEVGFKSDFELGSIPVRFNATGFINDYKDIQKGGADVRVLVGPPLVVQAGAATYNAGAANIKGVELESIVRLTQNLTLSGNYSFIDAHYNEFLLPGVLGAPPTDLTGIPYNGVARNQYSITGRYAAPLAETAGDLSFGATMTYQGRVYSSATARPAAEPTAYLPARRMVNLDVTWEKILRTPVSATFFMTNVFDVTTPVSTQANYGGLAFGSYLYSEPRMYGVKLNVSF